MVAVDQFQAQSVEPGDDHLRRSPLAFEIHRHVGDDEVAVQVGVAFAGVGVVEHGRQPLARTGA